MCVDKHAVPTTLPTSKTKNTNRLCLPLSVQSPAHTKKLHLLLPTTLMVGLVFQFISAAQLSPMCFGMLKRLFLLVLMVGLASHSRSHHCNELHVLALFLNQHRALKKNGPAAHCRCHDFKNELLCFCGVPLCLCNLCTTHHTLWHFLEFTGQRLLENGLRCVPLMLQLSAKNGHTLHVITPVATENTTTLLAHTTMN